jgi:leader peptidase (prepilin peptidase)/N-methyltransferase
VPFGPWMLAGAWLGIAAGTTIFTSYLSLFGLTAV